MNSAWCLWKVRLVPCASPAHACAHVCARTLQQVSREQGCRHGPWEHLFFPLGGNSRGTWHHRGPESFHHRRKGSQVISHGLPASADSNSSWGPQTRPQWARGGVSGPPSSAQQGRFGGQGTTGCATHCEGALGGRDMWAAQGGQQSLGRDPASGFPGPLPRGHSCRSPGAALCPSFWSLLSFPTRPAPSPRQASQMPVFLRQG